MTGQPEQSAHTSPKNRVPGTVAKLLVTALVIGYVVHKLGWRQIVATCGTIRLSYALCGLAATVVSIVLGAWQWHLLLHRKELRLTFRESFQLYYIGMFFNNIGTVAGDGIKVAYIKRRHSFGKIGFAATFLDRFAGTPRPVAVRRNRLRHPAAAGGAVQSDRAAPGSPDRGTVRHVPAAARLSHHAAPAQNVFHRCQ